MNFTYFVNFMNFVNLINVANLTFFGEFHVFCEFYELWDFIFHVFLNRFIGTGTDWRALQTRNERFIINSKEAPRRKSKTGIFACQSQWTRQCFFRRRYIIFNFLLWIRLLEGFFLSSFLLACFPPSATSNNQVMCLQSPTLRLSWLIDCKLWWKSSEETSRKSNRRILNSSRIMKR